MASSSLHAPESQSVTFVELFFDLVFVFAVTQITVALAHDLTWSGAVRSLLLFWLIWWAWTQFTWTLNPADTTHRAVRTITLAATGTAFVMAASVPLAYDDDALWFAIPYVVVRSLGLYLQARVDSERGADDAHLITRWAWGSTVGLVLVLAGALIEPPARNWLWVLVIVADLGAATLAGQGKTWDLSPSHVAERHGLFVIIALGESLIVAGAAIAGDERTAELVTAALASVVVVSLLWWTYFDWFKDSLEVGLEAAPPINLGRLTRDAYSLSHLPLVCGIIGVAVAVEEIMVHPEEAAPQQVLVALATGVALFLGSTVLAHWRLHGDVLGTRVAITVMTAVAVLVSPEWLPFWPLVAVAVGLVVLIVLERHRTVDGSSEPREGGGAANGTTSAGRPGPGLAAPHP
jgi:low temperature requirement protein LtrA